MLISEIIVGLWLVPVVLFIIIPLSMLCIWIVYQLLKRISDQIVQIHMSTDEIRDKSHVPGLHPKPVA
ncbi:MAG: hypothetical protein GY786_16240 [Proteobacteria bacterium]|nr:hypothetical protein [Pseudomonadota bacterium]